jgi:hypothetical protein
MTEPERSLLVQSGEQAGRQARELLRRPGRGCSGASKRSVDYALPALVTTTM